MDHIKANHRSISRVSRSSSEIDLDTCTSRGVVASVMLSVMVLRMVGQSEPVRD